MKFLKVSVFGVISLFTKTVHYVHNNRYLFK